MMQLTCPTCGSTDVLPAVGVRRPLTCNACQPPPAPPGFAEPDASPYAYATEPWEHRQPIAAPDAHHDAPLVVNGGVVWQQRPPVHSSGAQYQARGPRRRQPRGAVLIHAVERVRAIVTPEQAECVVLRAQGYTRAEIAEIVGVTEQAVKERLKRGDAAIRRAR